LRLPGRILRIHVKVRFHSKVPLMAFLGLVHFSIAFFGLVLGGSGAAIRVASTMVHGAFAQEQSFACQMGIDRMEDGLGQVVLFQ